MRVRTAWLKSGSGHEVLATECKSGPAADGRLVALALALVADLEALR